MDTRAALKAGIDMGNMITQSYLGDLSDSDLLVRVIPGINHIAWQLGHLIASENMMINEVCPGALPALPPGFAEKHSSETSKSDNAADFLKKDEYLKIAAEQRQGTLNALAKLSDAELGKPSPEKWQGYAPTVGDLFSMQGSHWVMHAGQWAVLRRKLGKPPLF